MTTRAEKDAREARARLTTSQAKEAALVDRIKAALYILDDIGLSAYDRGEIAAAILEAAIGRPPRRDPIP